MKTMDTPILPKTRSKTGHECSKCNAQTNPSYAVIGEPFHWPEYACQDAGPFQRHPRKVVEAEASDEVGEHTAGETPIPTKHDCVCAICGKWANTAERREAMEQAIRTIEPTTADESEGGK